MIKLTGYAQAVIQDEYMLGANNSRVPVTGGKKALTARTLVSYLTGYLVSNY